jgi:hypothetical protein
MTDTTVSEGGMAPRAARAAFSKIQSGVQSWIAMMLFATIVGWSIAAAGWHFEGLLLEFRNDQFHKVVQGIQDERDHVRPGEPSKTTKSRYDSDEKLSNDYKGHVSIDCISDVMWVMTVLWALMVINILLEMAGRAPIRPLAALNEPPGDIFTLVGVGSTFLGLTLSLVSLPSDIIWQLFHIQRTPDDYGEGLAAGALIFGSSLALGLLASLLGVIYSVAAKCLCAQYCREVKSPADLSSEFSLLGQELTNVVGHLRKIEELLPAALIAPDSGGAKDLLDALNAAIHPLLDDMRGEIVKLRLTFDEVNDRLSGSLDESAKRDQDTGQIMQNFAKTFPDLVRRHIAEPLNDQSNLLRDILREFLARQNAPMPAPDNNEPPS